jgi:large repetitive protein
MHCSQKYTRVKSSIIVSALVLAMGVDLMVCSSVAQSAPPQISSFSPIEGPVGTSVAIQGTSLTNIASLQFNGTEASFNILADIVTAIVPTNATTGPIRIETKAGITTSATPFTVTRVSAPTITSFLPASGEAGTSVEIKGANLASVNSVKFNGTEATFSVLAGALFATVPLTATSGPISVTTPGGTAASSAAFNVTVRGAPIVTGFSPTSGPAGASIEIQGTNLVNVTSVKFNGVNAAFLSFGEALRATVPANATSGAITVTTTSGSSTSSALFLITSGPPPAIGEFIPASGNLGTAVEIRGQFLRDAISVKFNGAEAVFTTSLFQPLSAIVPTNASTGPITVTTRAGTAVSAENFVVLNPVVPFITRLSVPTGRAGEVIQIHGTNLTGIVSVEFQGTAANFIEFTAERLLAIVPTNALSGPIKVRNRFGSAVSADTFTVLGAPPSEPPVLSIQALSPKAIELSWKVTPGFRLETSESLTPATQWSPSALPVAEVQGRATVAITADAKVRFYRLNKL